MNAGWGPEQVVSKYLRKMDSYTKADSIHGSIGDKMKHLSTHGEMLLQVHLILPHFPRLPLETNNITPAFDLQPYTVVGRKGSLISAKRGERVITRNTSFFKHVPLIHQANLETDRDDGAVITEVDDVQQSDPLKHPVAPRLQR